jgi:lipoprotein signal peptidase
MVEGIAFVLAQNEVSVNLTLPGIIALIAGVLILIYPRILNYVVAFYLILVGAIEVFDIKI